MNMISVSVVNISDVSSGMTWLGEDLLVACLGYMVISFSLGYFLHSGTYQLLFIAAII